MWDVQLNFPSVLVLLAATLSFFVAALLWQKKGIKTANKLLALALFAVAIHLTEYGLAIAQITLKFPHIIAISYPFLFCIAPLYYLYLKALLHNQKLPVMQRMLHFIPTAIVLLLFIPFYIQPAEEKRAFILSLAKQGYIKVPLAQLIIMFTHIFQLLIYSFLAVRVLKKIEIQVLQQFSNNELLKIKKQQTIAKALAVFSVVYFIGTTALVLTERYRVEIDFFVVLLFALLIIVFAFSVLAQPQYTAAIKVNGSMDRVNKGLIKKLEDVIKSEKPYLNSDLKIDDLAQMLNIPYYQLSEIINTHYNTNFFDFINHKRVEEAKKLLDSGSNEKILAIAFDSGFSNKATFNRIFKKSTGYTPTQYKNRSQLVK
jgi:AraC-like DNA-binding protein